jgi:hypothetical protein
LISEIGGHVGNLKRVLRFDGKARVAPMLEVSTLGWKQGRFFSERTSSSVKRLLLACKSTPRRSAPTNLAARIARGYEVAGRPLAPKHTVWKTNSGCN